MENQTQFNIWKSQVEDIDLKTELDCLRVIELNITDKCNMTCSMCPHSKGFVGNSFMSLDIVKEISLQLYTMKFKGYICIAGFGEPTLHPQLIEILETLRPHKVVIVSNGSIKNIDWKRISELSTLKISVHDWSKIDEYRQRFEGITNWFRNHDETNPEMNIYNRAGFFNPEPTEGICYYPFYKTMIDVDGHYLQCDGDWLRNSRTDYTVFDKSIDKFYLEELKINRDNMLDKGRQKINCCKTCNIHGNLLGDKFVDFFRKENKNV